MRYSLRTTTLKAHSCLLYERIENSPNGRKTKSTLKITREKCEWGKEEKKAKGNVSGKKRETNGVEEVVANGGKLSPALPSTLLTLLQPVASTICNHANCHTTELVCHTHVGCLLSLGFSLSTLLIVFFFSPSNSTVLSATISSRLLEYFSIMAIILSITLARLK